VRRVASETGSIISRDVVHWREEARAKANLGNEENIYGNVAGRTLETMKSRMVRPSTRSTDHQGGARCGVSGRGGETGDGSRGLEEEINVFTCTT